MYQNFFGKDPMKWWIGQVTDPDKGEWGDSLEKAKAENPDDDIYTLRCRVRIVGYHACEDDLPDKDLPLAHVLLPPNTTTVGGTGQTMQYQGGEVVVGFFFDGDDAQQPVIFGTLFKQSFVGDQLSNKDFDGKKHTCFVPYTPPKVVQRSGKHRYNSNWQPQSPPLRGFSPGEVVTVAAQLQKEAATNFTIDQYSPCEENEISKISNAIKDFTRKMEQLQSIGGGSAVDPIYGGVVDIQQEIKLTAARIHNSTTQLVRRGRSWLIQETLDKLSTTLKDKVPKPLQAPTGQATSALVDVIFCNLEKIQEGLAEYLSKSLENMIGQVLDVPICGIENFLSDMFGQINGIIDNELGDMFSQLNTIQGGGIGAPSDTFSKAIKYANIITNILDCDRQNCAEPNSYSSKNGVSISGSDSFGGILEKVGLKKLEAGLLSTLDNAIPAVPSAPDCSTNVLKCGPPRVDFIGSSGQGASGNAIVNAIGNIIGVSINGPGFGFEEPPLLSFFDSCDNGFGAGGYPVMGPVSFLVDGTNVSVGGVGGLPLTSNNLPVNVGGVGGIPVIAPNGQLILVDGAQVVAGGIGGTPVTAGGTGGTPLTVDGIPLVVDGKGGQGLIAGAFPVVVGATDSGVGAGAGGAGTGGAGAGAGAGGVDAGGAGAGGAGAGGAGAGGAGGAGAGGAGGVDAGAAGGIDADTSAFDGFNITVGGEPNPDGLYVYDPNGTELGVVNVVITNPGQGYLPNTTETTLNEDGSLTTTEVTPDPNANYDGEQTFLTSLGDVVVTNTGFGYEDGDTVTVDGGITDDGTGTGGAEVELEIQDGRIIGAKVTNGGFGFTDLPDLTINSDSGVGARLLPVLNFTKVKDASKLVESVRQSAVTVISCITK